MFFIQYEFIIITMRKIFLIELTVICTFSAFGQNILNDFVSGKYRQKSFYGVYASKNPRYFYKQFSNGVLKYSFDTGKLVDTTVNGNSKELTFLGGIEDFSFGKNDDIFMLSYDSEAIYRYSYYAKYCIYSPETKSVKPVADSNLIRDATLSPNNLQVAYVINNNLYFQNIKSGSVTQITKDGKRNSIINGAPDWVYEEEFSLLKAFRWSPDSKFIAFYKFDESEVREYPLTIYGNENYPSIYSYKYPKAGEKNSKVSVYTYELATGKITKMDIGADTDQYIPEICWSNQQGKLAIVRLNRLQNKLDILFADAFSGISKMIYTEESKTYINELPKNYITFLENSNKLLITSEISGFNQIYLINPEMSDVKQITNIDGEVIEVVGYNNSNSAVYFKAHGNGATGEEIYSIVLDSKEINKISQSTGTSEIKFSSDFSKYLLYYQNIKRPMTVSLYNISGKCIDTLEGNSNLNAILSKDEIPMKSLFSFKTTENVQLNGWLMKPVDFDSTKKYPVLIYVYGGPGVQTVKDEFRIDWLNYLASVGYIIASVDNRGTGGRGRDFRSVTYRNLGFYETLDQIEVAKYIGSLSYVDPGRIGIYGWSYGGYMAAMCILKGPEIFKMGISVAPPTDWRFYDSVYTERYMGLPSDNEKGYNLSSPILYSDSLIGKYLIVHGTGDDNVHLHNSMDLIEALVQSNKQFEMQFYKDKNHGIRGGNTSLHVYTRMIDFVKKNL